VRAPQPLSWLHANVHQYPFAECIGTAFTGPGRQMILLAIACLTSSAQCSATSFFRGRKPKDEKRLFVCERRLRNAACNRVD